MIRIIHGNALDLPIPDATVDLVVTSPPYFGLRSYQDNGEHYDGQIGSEATPAEFVDALIAATREMVRVLKPSGSIWVNLGDKYAGGSVPLNTTRGYTERTCPSCGRAFTSGRNKCHKCGVSTRILGDRGPVTKIVGGTAPPKSLIGIPWRYALRCIDDLGLILRAEVIWSKPNGLPESVTDRVRRSHEQWFYFQQSGGVEAATESFPFCPLCGRPVDACASLVARLHEIGGGVESLNLPNHKGPDMLVKDERARRPDEQVGRVAGGAGVALLVDADAEHREDVADLDEDRVVGVVDHHSEVRATGSAVTESDRPLSVDDASEPREVCNCVGHPLIIQDEPWIPQSLAAELVQMVANGEADAQHVADYLSGDYARTHSTWFHFTVQPRYYSAVDEVREAYEPDSAARRIKYGQADRGGGYATGDRNDANRGGPMGFADAGNANPLGKLPGSVWTIPTQPLTVPAHLGIDHFAAFPMEWPRRIITGWSPREVCGVCGEGRRPVVDKKYTPTQGVTTRKRGFQDLYDAEREGAMRKGTGLVVGNTTATITGYACACPDTSAPTTPGLVLDPFGGTGTVALIADVLGRDAIHVDLSSDYCRLAEWRTTDPGERARAMKVEKPEPVIDGQMDLWEGLGA